MTTSTTVRRLAALALVGAAVVGCADDPLVTPEDEPDVAGAAEYELVIDDGLDYEPRVLTVPAGSVVEVRNRSSQAHSVTAVDTAAVDFDTGMIPEGDSAQLVVAEPGRYAFHCRQHRDVMEGVLVVE